jgi:hypothetical protein
LLRLLKCRESYKSEPQIVELGCREGGRVERKELLEVYEKMKLKYKDVAKPYVTASVMNEPSTVNS